MTKYVAKFSALKQSKVPVYQRVRVTRKNARNSAIIERVQGLISNDPEQSLRKLASIVGVGKPMRRIVEEDLQYKSNTIKIRFRYSAKANRVVCCNMLFFEKQSVGTNQVLF